MIVLIIVVVYVLLAVFAVWFLRRHTERKLYRRLAVACVVLLPIWDVVLGYLVYYPACMFIPKVATYETAETEGIYYEGINDEVYKGELRYSNKVEQVDKVSGLYFWQGKEEFKYLESKVTKKRTASGSLDSHKIIPMIYRCISLPKERADYTPERCSKVEKAESPYMVEVKTIKICITEINFKKVYRRSNEKLMAEYNRVSRWGYAGLWFIPFFEWLDWRWWSKSEGSAHCPSPDKYENFELEVLKPKIGRNL